MTETRTPPDPKEIVQLAAQDSIFFCRQMLPDTYRQPFAIFHPDVWNLLEDLAHRQIALKMFRGSAKTTILRTFCLKRACYGISRTILFVSASQAHAVRSVQWLRGRIERNKQIQYFYRLAPGAKWTDEWLEIQHRVLGITINIIAAGMTGQIRGINIDDYRPDLVICDDPNDEENTATPEQREKSSNRFFGSLLQSLTPATENPASKIVLLQTPLADGDLIDICTKDPTWASREYGCFDDDGESRWPDRFPTSTLQSQKQSHAQRGELKLWLREMEVTIVADELMDFRPDWLQYWHTLEAEARIPCFLAIDPVPPPSDREAMTGLQTKDFEALSVVGYHQGGFYLLETSKNRGHQPDWTIAEFFRLASKWRPIKVRVESIAYQRTLNWLLDREMRERRTFYTIEPITDRRKKRHRIVQAFSPIASKGMFFVHPTQTDFIEQFTHYPQLKHDDVIDATAMALDAAMEFAGAYSDREETLALEGVPDRGYDKMLESFQGAP